MLISSHDDRRIFLGMPGYGSITGGASRGYWRSTRRPDSHVYYGYNEGSLLAANFNALWCEALNRCHRGQRVDYFAMQHADVEPQDWWLDNLIDELESNQLDLLGCVVPIKDDHGLTSLALDRPDGDTWRPLARLTMTEIYRLPKTFTSRDVGHDLLLNTGLWVCKFDPEWAKKVSFTINDRIAFDRNRDCYIAQCEPEDWYFSRLCHEIGLKIGATRKIHLTHRGGKAFDNNRVWGQPFDMAWTDKSQIPDDGFLLPLITGWLTHEEGRTLAELATGKRVLEIGSYLGLSTVSIARTATHVTAVDPHDGRETPVPSDTLNAFKLNLQTYGVTNKVAVFVGTSSEFRTTMKPGTFDLVYIDGGHGETDVANDIACAVDALTPDGLIAFHDYQSVDPFVTSAVDELIARGGRLISVSDSLAVVRPPASVFQEV